MDNKVIGSVSTKDIWMHAGFAKTVKLINLARRNYTELKLKANNYQFVAFITGPDSITRSINQDERIQIIFNK